MTQFPHLCIREDGSLKKAILRVTLFAVLSLFGGIFLFTFLLPVYSGCLGAVMILEKKHKPISVVLMVLAGVLSYFAGIGGLIGAGAAILCGLAIWFGYSFGFHRGGIVLLLTVLWGGGFLLQMMVGVAETGSAFSLAALVEWFRDSLTSVGEEWEEAFRAGAAGAYDETVLSSFATVFEKFAESVMNAAPAIVAVIGFILSGIGCKVFSRLLTPVMEHPEYIRSYRFWTSNLFAYAFLAAFVLRTFGASSDPDAFMLVITNLSYVLTAVYAYIGASGALRALRVKKSPFVSAFLLLLFLAVGGMIAVEILSIYGAISLIVLNRKFASFDGRNDPPEV